MAKIAIMLPLFSRYGGVEQFGYRLAEALAGLGHQVDLICARQEVAAPNGVNVIATGRPRGPRIAKLLSFAKNAEAVRAAGNYDCAISLGKTLAQDILRVGGGPLQQFWKYSEQALPEGMQRNLKRLKHLTDPYGRYAIKIEETQYQSNTKIVAVSDFVRKLILAQYPKLKQEDITVIYNKPDLSKFTAPTTEERKSARGALGIPEGITAIGLVTSNFELKGTGPLIRSLVGLPESYSLYIAGGRDHASYDRLAKRNGVSHRVHFLGKVENMPEYYKALDVFALPSFYDACSNAVLEALATGLPVLSTKSNGSSFFLPKENIIENPADSLELAEKLQIAVASAHGLFSTKDKRAFCWPDKVRAGLDEFIRFVEDFLAEKGAS